MNAVGKNRVLFHIFTSQDMMLGILEIRVHDQIQIEADAKKTFYLRMHTPTVPDSRSLPLLVGQSKSTRNISPPNISPHY